MPMSAQVRLLSTSPRRTTSGPIVVPTNLATTPSGPNTWPISAGVAWIWADGANGYLAASVFRNGSTTWACHVLLISDSEGSTIIANVCTSGRTSSGRSICFCVSVIPVSICSSTYFSASASSDPLPSSVCCISCLAPGPGSPWFFSWFRRLRSFDNASR